MRDFTFIVACLLITGGATLSDAQPRATTRDTTTPPGYTLVWADEFTRNGWPDPRNWTYERGFVRNQELQWYQADNAVIRDGFLVIEARRETRPVRTFEQGSTDWRRNRPHTEITSTSLTTRGMHSWRYGRFEMRAKIDIRAGIWPAFWTVGDAGRWPASGEIDIMEYYRGMLLANVAWAADANGKSAWDDSKKPIAELGGDAWARRFHVWRMDWDESAIRLYVDDVLLNETDLQETVNKDGSGRNPLQQPHHIILNLAVGGTNGGDHTGTTFPSRFEIDYVRVYQRTTSAPSGAGSSAAR